ncbi:MAG: glycoside hydrolase family 43 protein [Bacteroides sp.]|nr:glycoside hydrolase family 43 protein [Bacteroides sp.]
MFFTACKQPARESAETAEKEYYVFTSFHEPADEGLRFLYSEDGIRWDSIPGVWLKPVLGKHQIMRDPSLVRTPDGTYHLVWTTSWKSDLGFGYSSSTDLIHWTPQQMIEVMAHEPTTVNVWAPEIYYDDETEEFMVVWASCVPGRFEKGIEDEDNNHRLYYITTKDFQTISETKLFYDPGFSVIDAIVVKRAPEDYIMVVKDNTRPNRNLRIAFADSYTGPYTEPSAPFTDTFVEGPSVAKIGDQYYIFFDAYREMIYCAVSTTDFINFTDRTGEVSIPNGHKHGTIFKAPSSVVDNLLSQTKDNQ